MVVGANRFRSDAQIIAVLTNCSGDFVWAACGVSPCHCRQTGGVLNPARHGLGKDSNFGFAVVEIAFGFVESSACVKEGNG